MTRSGDGFVFTATLVFVSLVISCLVQFAVGIVPSELRDRLDAYRVLWPQRWPFFTGLGEDVLVAYVVAGDEHRSTGRGGFEFPMVGRAGDADMNEVRRLAVLIPDRYWQVCGKVTVDECRIETARGATHSMVNPSSHPRLCGTFAVTVEQVAPPGANRLPADLRRVHRLAVVDVRCAG